MSPIIIFVAIGAIFGTLGQFFLKLLASRVSLDFSANFLKNFLGLFLEPLAYLAGLAYVASTIFYLKALKTAPLSSLYAVFIGITIILTFLGGLVFLRESVDIFKIIGSALILFGILLIFVR